MTMFGVVIPVILAATLAATAFNAASAASRQTPLPRSTGRASTTNMSCAQAKSVVDRSGAVVLGTGGQTYDRFVRLEAYCPTGLFARPAFEPTRDNAQCYIGYYCSDAPPFFPF